VLITLSPICNIFEIVRYELMESHFSQNKKPINGIFRFLISPPRGASIEHLLNLHFRPEGIGAVCAQASVASSTNRDKGNVRLKQLLKL
jgi:hypothetical protein